MNVSRFIGATARDAMRLVRHALGDSAMIVSNKTVDGGVEIIAVDEAQMTALEARPEAAPAASSQAAPQPVAQVGPPQTLRQALQAASQPPVQTETPRIARPGSQAMPQQAPRMSEMVHAAQARQPLQPAQSAQPPQSHQPAQPLQPAQTASFRQTLPAPLQQPAGAVAPKAADTVAMPEGQEVMGAIGALRGALENRIDGMLWGENLRRAPVGIAVFRELLGAGFSTALARTLSERLPRDLDRDEALAWVRNELASHLPVLDDDKGLLAGGGVFALVGPTGVGKTTTTAKLAARCVMKYGADRVAMLTTDGYRIGAHEQLLIYGRILGIPVLPAGDAQALQQALTELRGKHIVLIDTVGMSQRDQNVAEQAAMLCAGGRPVRRLLLLNSAVHGDTLDEVAHAYRQDSAGQLMGCIITKVDEATHLGAVLDTVIRHRLPVHYVCTGQKVPENMALPRPRELVDRAFAAAGARALFAPTEADFAALWSVAHTQPASLSPATLEAQRARRQRNLRTAVAGANYGCTQADFDRALATVQESRAFSLAQDLWRDHAAGGQDAAAMADSMLADVHAHFSSTCDRFVLALHGRTRSVPARCAPTWHALTGSLLFSDRGQALASPARHLMTPHGVVASFDSQGASPASAATGAILARADWLQARLSRVPMVHVFDGFTPAIAQHMQASRAPWLARCTATPRVMWQDSRITVGALAKLLGYAPAGQVRHEGRACTRWVAATVVELADRAAVRGDDGESASSVRLVSTRLIADDNGECLLQILGLAQIDDVSPVKIAGWLELADAARACQGWAQAAIERLGPQASGAHAMPATMLAGAQLGLAGWHMVRNEPASAGALLGKSVSEASGATSRQRAGVESLIRLFAALDMMLEQAA